MGWLFMHHCHMGGHKTAKAYLDAQFTYSHIGEDGSVRGLRVLASACPGNRVWYAAAQVLENDVPGEVFAIVCLVRWDPRSTDGHQFGYKDMTETMGPYEDGCPARILDMLTPTTNAHAHDWRRRCRANLQRRSRKIVDGMRIKLARALSFTDGHHGDTFIVVKRGAMITFRPEGGRGHYRIRRFRELDWSVVPETRVHRTIFAAAPGPGSSQP
ncbi:DUF6927 domain-containing protein [Novosphingobium sp.]|uniref:DUF6927 domain-containing protein n=1 Tax=Novosphingobium sp. TaxID=1874826 RepID=UPI002FE027D9